MDFTNPTTFLVIFFALLILLIVLFGPYIDTVVATTSNTSRYTDLIETTITWKSPSASICTIENPVDTDDFVVKSVTHVKNVWTAVVWTEKLTEYADYKIVCTHFGMTAKKTIPTFTSQCIVGSTQIKLATGLQAIANVKVGDLVEQADGSWSKVQKVHSSLVFSGVKLPDRRLFSNKDGSVIVTYWHKILDEETGAMVLPEAHKAFHELDAPADVVVFNLALETPTDVILSEGLVLESLHP
jgi:hypothetical protein